MTYWRRTRFWTKVKDSIALLGPGTEVILLIADSHHAWMYVTAASTFFGYLISIWFADNDNNGIPDIFEDPVKKVG